LPGVQMSAVKETHYFDNETEIDWSAPDYALYHSHFSTDGRFCRGEATPIYSYWPNSLERIKRYNPDIKLVLLFRDPVERACSHWKMEFARGAEAEAFSWCIREGRARVAQDPDTPGFHRVYSYVERGFYGGQIERVYRLFDRRQVLVLKSEDLRDQADATVRRVCRFLGANEPSALVANRTVHAAAEHDYGQALHADDVAYLRELYRGDLTTFEQLTGIATAPWISDSG